MIFLNVGYCIIYSLFSLSLFLELPQSLNWDFLHHFVCGHKHKISISMSLSMDQPSLIQDDIHCGRDMLKLVLGVSW